MSSSSARTARVASERSSLPMVSAIWRRLRAMVRLVTISTITKICAVSARASGLSTPAMGP